MKDNNTILELIEKVILPPFLFCISLGSRSFYDYLKTNKKPTTKDIVAHLVLGLFVMTLTYYIMVDYGIDRKKITWVVMIMGFLNHTFLTFILENWEKIAKKITKNGI